MTRMTGGGTWHHSLHHPPVALLRAEYLLLQGGVAEYLGFDDLAVLERPHVGLLAGLSAGGDFGEHDDDVAVREELLGRHGCLLPTSRCNVTASSALPLKVPLITLLPVDIHTMLSSKTAIVASGSPALKAA